MKKILENSVKLLARKTNWKMLPHLLVNFIIKYAQNIINFIKSVAALVETGPRVE